ncbi:multidrug resistance-associated protein 1, partial [Caerostris extrusa]
DAFSFYWYSEAKFGSKTGEYTDDELWTALDLANLRTSIPYLDCAVGDYLSPKERYLFSVARCLLKKPKIVFIDDLENADSNQVLLFPESTVLLFCGEPISDFYGRIIRLMSGEVIEEDFYSS